MDFSFTKNAMAFDDTTMFVDNTRQFGGDDDDDDDAGDTGFGFGGMENGNAPVEDFFTGADAVNDDFAGDFGGDDFGGDNDNHSNGGDAMGGGHAGEGEGGRSGPFVPFDPRRLPNERDFVLAMNDADGEGGALDYFDQNILKNWAGPEHWKLRKVIRRRE